ncbi:MAG: hypothetical protein ACKVP5_22525, partial [Aestuariivirga sp.]
AAKLAQAPERWRWSSARAYLKGANDGLTVTGPMRGRFPGIRALLGPGGEELDGLTVRADETIGRPRGSAAFIARIEKKTGRTLAPAKRGPVPRVAGRKPKVAARPGK